MLSSCLYAVGIIVVILTILWWRSRQWRKDLPPGPPCFPIIGNIGMIDTSNTIAEFDRLRKEYGDVFCFVVGSSPVIILNGSEAIRDLFVKEADSLSITPPAFFLTKIANWKGIVASNGHLWREQRSFALKTLREFGFGKQSLESQIQQEVDVLLRCLECSKGQPFEFVVPLKVCIMNVISSMSMGRTYGFDDERLLTLIDMIEWLFSDPDNRNLAAFVPFSKYIPGDPLRFSKREKVIGKILNFLSEVVAEHKRSLDKVNVHDYIDAFLIAKEKIGEDVESTFSGKVYKQYVQDNENRDKIIMNMHASSLYPNAKNTEA